MDKKWPKIIIALNVFLLIFAGALAGYTLMQQIGQAHGQVPFYPTLNLDLHTYQSAAVHWQNHEPLYELQQRFPQPNLRRHPIFVASDVFL